MEQEVLNWLRSHSPARSDELAEAFPQYKYSDIRNVLTALIRSGQVNKKLNMTEDVNYVEYWAVQRGSVD